MNITPEISMLLDILAVLILSAVAEAIYLKFIPVIFSQHSPDKQQYHMETEILGNIAYAKLLMAMPVLAVVKGLNIRKQSIKANMPLEIFLW